jgi:hypothetical protein
VERAAAKVGEDELGDAEVVGDEIALRQPAGGEERLVGIRDLDGRSIVETCWKAIRSRT